MKHYPKHDAIINIAAYRTDSTSSLLNKVELTAKSLGTVADVKVGLGAYGIDKGIPPQTEAMIEKRIYHSLCKEGEDWFPYLEGKDVSRYHLGWSGEYLKHGDHLREPRRNWGLFSTPRILVRQIPSQPPYSIHACYTTDVLLNDRNSMNIINIQDSPLYLLGIINSRLITFWFIHKFGKLQRGVFPQFKTNELSQFPIAIATKEQQNAISQHVEMILAVKKTDPAADTSALEREIDRLVYELYGLTDDEIAVVRGDKL